MPPWSGGDLRRASSLLLILGFSSQTCRDQSKAPSSSACWGSPPATSSFVTLGPGRASGRCGDHLRSFLRQGDHAPSSLSRHAPPHPSLPPATVAFPVGMHRGIAMKHKGSFTSKYSQGGQISPQVTVRQVEGSGPGNGTPRACGEHRAGNRPHGWKDGRQSREQLRPEGPEGEFAWWTRGTPGQGHSIGKGTAKSKQFGMTWEFSKSLKKCLDIKRGGKESAGEMQTGGLRDISYDSASVHTGQRPARCGSSSPETGQPASHSLVRKY